MSPPDASTESTGETSTPQTSSESDRLSGSEIRRRASAGMFITASWGFLNLVFGFVGNLVLARMLVPHDFGLVAVGMTFFVFANSLSDGGLWAAFLRRPETPQRPELRLLLGVQLSVTTVLALVIAGAASPFGEAGAIVGIIIAGLPLTTLQTPGRVMLVRSLLYQRVAMVDVTGLTAYYAWAIAGVAAGFGVWALATAAVARAVAGSAVIGRVSGLGWVTPSLRGVRGIRSILGFGIRFQAVGVVMMVRDQGLNAATGVVAGVSTLGLWSFINRLMQVPLLFFDSLWRVSLPSMSQLLAAKEDPRGAIERGVTLSAVASGLMLTTFAGSAPELIPTVFGEQWRSAADVVPWACLALLVSGPISTSTVGYLYAANRPSAVLRASIALCVTWFVVGIPLLPFVGVTALGIGWFAGSIADAVVLVRSTKRVCDVTLVRPVVVPILAAVGAGGVGWSIASAGEPGLLSAGAGGAAAAAVYLAVMFLFRRSLLLQTVRAVVRSLKAALPVGSPAKQTEEPA